MLRTFLIRLCIVATLPGSTAWAAVVPGPIFGDGMVLQRDRPVPVWGRAAAGETVESAGETVESAGAARTDEAAINNSTQPRRTSLSGQETPPRHSCLS